ncbi:MAG: magnesium transporter CorA family protein [Chloroflexi bacterium]|nr:magnesium transporter CorA family protein [Chloroflexota bacterium]
MLRSLVMVKPPSQDEASVQRNLSNGELEKALANGATVWIDIYDGVEDDLPWLETQLNLHPAVVRDLYRDDRRPTLLVYPHFLFLSLFQPQVHRNRVEAHEIHCLIGEDFYVTVRRAETRPVNEAYTRVSKDSASWEYGTVYFLFLTIQFVVDAYYPLLDKISLRLNELENTVLAGESVSQHIVYHLKHQLITLRQMLAPQREVLSDVIGQERLIRTPESRDLFRHLYERLLRVYDVLDSQRDFTSNVLDLIQTQESSRLTNAVNRLTILSMIFLPLTVLIGLFELNFITTDPGLVIPISGTLMLLVILGLIVVSIGSMSWFFRHKGWL